MLQNALKAREEGSTLVQIEGPSEGARVGYEWVKDRDLFEYWKAKRGHLTLHETIFGDRPCRLYLDVDINEDDPRYETFSIDDFCQKVAYHVFKTHCRWRDWRILDGSRDGKKSWHVFFPKMWVDKPCRVLEILEPFLNDIDVQVYPSANSVKSLRMVGCAKPTDEGLLKPVWCDGEMSEYDLMSCTVHGGYHKSMCVTSVLKELEKIESSTKRYRGSDTFQAASESECEPLIDFLTVSIQAHKFRDVTKKDYGVVSLICKGYCRHAGREHRRNNLRVFCTSNKVFQWCFDRECKGWGSVLHTFEKPGVFPSRSELLLERIRWAQETYLGRTYTWSELGLREGDFSKEVVDTMYTVQDGRVGLSKWQLDVFKNGKGSYMPWVGRPFISSSKRVAEKFELQRAEILKKVVPFDVRVLDPQIPVMLVFNGRSRAPKTFADVMMGFRGVWLDGFKLYKAEGAFEEDRKCVKWLDWKELCKYDPAVLEVRFKIQVIFGLENHAPTQYMYWVNKLAEVHAKWVTLHWYTG